MPPLVSFSSRFCGSSLLPHGTRCHCTCTSFLFACSVNTNEHLSFMVSQQSFSAGDQGFQALQLNHETSVSASSSMVSMPLLQTRDICGFHLSICGNGPSWQWFWNRFTRGPCSHAPGLTAVFMQLGAGQR